MYFPKNQPYYLIDYFGDISVEFSLKVGNNKVGDLLLKGRAG
jgi:hypothetical protein